MPEINVKILPSIEKCFLDETLASKPELREVTMLRNERLSFQFAYTYVCAPDDLVSPPKQFCELSVKSLFGEALTLSKIELVPVFMPAYPTARNDNYLRTEPGLYPDLLIPVDTTLPLVAVRGQLRALMVSIEKPEGLTPGDYEVEIAAKLGEEVASAKLKITVIDAILPDQTLIHTQWFHNDCLATYYHCEIFSDRYWELIGNYLKAAATCGINMILTPVLTPPLDTAVGHERPTVQLVDITVENGAYRFGYDKLDRYVKLALDAGMKYFEISHFFSQWGAIHAPKIMAAVNGEMKRIFGWETDSAGEDYTAFIRAFVSELLEHLKSLGIDQVCYFHISDEPSLAQLESYTRAKATIADLLDGYPIMDALSSYEFYATGACETPIPATNHIVPFLENHVPDLWTYYCCGQHEDVSNRFLSMPGARTRILGAQLYYYDIKGFLQWGFNFWYSQGSLHALNPFTDTCGDYFVPAGDTSSVYPGQDGQALMSLHALHFYEALQDMRALQLLDAKLGRERVTALIDAGCDAPMTFAHYPKSQEYLLGLRERVNRLLQA